MIWGSPSFEKHPYAMETCSHCDPVNAYHLRRWVSPSQFEHVQSNASAWPPFHPVGSTAVVGQLGTQISVDFFRACHCHGGDASFMSFELCLSAACARYAEIAKLTSALCGRIFPGLFSHKGWCIETLLVLNKGQQITKPKIHFGACLHSCPDMCPEM